MAHLTMEETRYKDGSKGKQFKLTSRVSSESKLMNGSDTLRAQVFSKRGDMTGSAANAAWSSVAINRVDVSARLYIKK